MYKAGTWHSHSIKCAARHLGFLSLPELDQVQNCIICAWQQQHADLNCCLCPPRHPNHVIFQDGLGCLFPHSDPRTPSGKIYQALEEGLTIYVWGVLNIWGEQLLFILEQHVMQNPIKFCFTHMMFLEILTGLTLKTEVQCLADTALLSVHMKFGNCCDILTCVAFEIIASRGWLIFIVQIFFHVTSQIQSDLKFLSDLGKLSLSLQPYDKI